MTDAGWMGLVDSDNKARQVELNRVKSCTEKLEIYYSVNCITPPVHRENLYVTLNSDSDEGRVWTPVFVQVCSQLWLNSLNSFYAYYSIFHGHRFRMLKMTSLAHLIFKCHQSFHCVYHCKEYWSDIYCWNLHKRNFEDHSEGQTGQRASLRSTSYGVNFPESTYVSGDRVREISFDLSSTSSV